MRPAYPIDGVHYRAEAEAEALYRCGAWLRLTIGDATRRVAALHGDRPFLREGEGVVTYAQFDAATERLAAALLQRGLRPGDRALFQMGTCAATAVALVGCFKAGVVPVCTLAQHREIEIGQLGAIAQPNAYFIQSDFHPTFDIAAFAAKMAREIGSVRMLIAARGERSGAESMEALIESVDPARARSLTAGVAIDPGDVAIFQLSGGSTGVPKIIPRMHGEYLAQARDWDDRLQLTRDDVYLWCLPLIHNAGVVVAFLPSLLAGRTLVLQAAFQEEQLLSAIERYRVAYTGSIGPIAGRLLEYPDASRFDLGSLKQVWAFNRADDLEQRLGMPAQCIYGITEGILMSSSRDAPRERRHGTVGNPVGRRDEIELRPAGGEGPPVADGELGELCFKGASVLRAYYGVAPSADQFTSDGFFRTGDLVRAHWVDGERCFVFEGRMKDNISRGGEKYGAEEVEALLVKHPAILDARVVAMPDRLYGEKGCAYLVLRKDVAAPSLGELASFLSGLGLARYKAPERIEVLGEFPLTRVGKVDKGALRERIAALVKAEQGA